MATQGCDGRWISLGSVIVALMLARPFAGGWNDGSRLATIEALVDHGTLAIDHSIFVRVPPDRSPYPRDRPDLVATGTLDKLRIDGQYFSDKAPVPAILLAAVYAGIQSLTGLTAAEWPAGFCYLLNFLGGGIPFALALLALHALARDLLPSRRTLWLITASFVFATVAPAYARHHNGHILMLAVSSAIVCSLQRIHLSQDARQPTAPVPLRQWFLVGTWAGFGYTVDLAVGPALFLAVGAWCFWLGGRLRSVRPIVGYVVASAPWLLAHHSIVWSFAHTLGPPAAHPEYLAWPGSPFSPENMTGLWHDRGVGRSIMYAGDLLFGLRGFVWYNLPIVLAGWGLLSIWRTNVGLRPLVLAHLSWCGLAYAAYALTSTNYSGQCLTIRWFVPMLAPMFWLLILTLRLHPCRKHDLMVLTAFGFVPTIVGVWNGPWERFPLAVLWLTVPSAGVVWFFVGWHRRKEKTQRRRKLGPLLQFFGLQANNTSCCPSLAAGGGTWPSSSEWSNLSAK